MRALTFDEIDEVSGGGGVADAASGLGLLGGIILGVALAPVETVGFLALTGAAIGVVAAGALMSVGVAETLNGSP